MLAFVKSKSISTKRISLDAPICDTKSFLSLLHYQPSRFVRSFYKSNRGIRITFPSNTLFFFFLFFSYAHRKFQSYRMFHWMFRYYIEPYWGSSLSKLVLNARRSHAMQVKFLRATFLPYHQENRITSHLTDFLNRRTYWQQYSVFSLLHYHLLRCARKLSPTVPKKEHLLKTHRFFIPFFTHVEFYFVTECFNGYFHLVSMLAKALVSLRAPFVRRFSKFEKVIFMLKVQ